MREFSKIILTGAIISAAVFISPSAWASYGDNLRDTEACTEYSRDDAVTKNFKYTLNGQEGEVSATMYPQLDNCLGDLKQETALPNGTHAQKEDADDKLTIENVSQQDFFKELADNIKKITDNTNDQARIVASIGQGFEYEDNDPDEYNYPYEVAFDQKGICNETAKFMIGILRELGFGTAMLTFEKDNHQVAGIKCDPKFSYNNSGYCYIETTTRAIITDDTGIKSQQRANVISDGLAFDAAPDFSDAQKYVSILEKGRNKATGNEKEEMKNLRQKYGIS
ncbi:MAG TPA: transglutaminase domain-containing protein [Patescibacteria group bacterium]|nr:transglutaminase domain-containing protein [Patescibacteria group bacterium]